MSVNQKFKINQKNFSSTVKQKLGEISRKNKKSMNAVLIDFQKVCLEMKEKFGISDEKELYNHSIGVLFNRECQMMAQKDYFVIPIGFTGIRKARKKGTPYSEVFAVVSESKNFKPFILARIMLRGKKIAGIYKELLLFHKYEGVKLTVFRNSNDYQGDDRTKLINPKPMKLNPIKFMAKVREQLDIPTLPISEAPYNLSKFQKSSKKKSDGEKQKYIDKTDWKYIEALIVRSHSDFRDDGTEYGIYTISDVTTTGEAIVKEDGTVIQPGFPTWIEPNLMMYELESKCGFYGTISLSKEGEAQMNCYCLVPIRAKIIEIDEDEDEDDE